MSMDDRQDSKSPKASAAPTGTRSDDSSLFSLDKLRKAEESANRSERERDRDDSGLIDLHALAALSSSAPSPNVVSPLTVSASASLFAVSPATAPIESPLSAVDMSAPAELPAKRRTKFMVLGGLGAVAVAAVAFLVMQGSSTPPAAVATNMAPALTTPEAPPAAVAAPAPEEPKMAAVVPGQRAPVEEPKAAAPVAVAAVAKPVAVAAVARPAAPRPAAVAPAPKEPAKPAAPTCDLTCQMQRAVSKPKSK